MNATATTIIEVCQRIRTKSFVLINQQCQTILKKMNQIIFLSDILSLGFPTLHSSIHPLQQCHWKIIFRKFDEVHFLSTYIY